MISTPQTREIIAYMTKSKTRRQECLLTVTIITGEQEILIYIDY